MSPRPGTLRAQVLELATKRPELTPAEIAEQIAAWPESVRGALHHLRIAGLLGEAPPVLSGPQPAGRRGAQQAAVLDCLRSWPDASYTELAEELHTNRNAIARAVWRLRRNGVLPSYTPPAVQASGWDSSARRGACPRCGAADGQPCKRRDNLYSSWTHSARRRA